MVIFDNEGRTTLDLQFKQSIKAAGTLVFLFLVFRFLISNLLQPFDCERVQIWFCQYLELKDYLQLNNLLFFSNLSPSFYEVLIVYHGWGGLYVLSSANIISFAQSKHLQKSSIQIRNNNGLSSEPVEPHT